MPSFLCISFHSSLDVHVPKRGSQKLQFSHGLTFSPSAALSAFTVVSSSFQTLEQTQPVSPLAPLPPTSSPLTLA